jgi:hypothetical protein
MFSQPKRSVWPHRRIIDSVSTNVDSPDTYLTFIEDRSDSSGMSSQRTRAPRGGARAGTHETGEETQLWNETLEKLAKLEKNEARAKELRNEIFDNEANMKRQEDAGTSTKPNSLAGILLTPDRAIY